MGARQSAEMTEALRLIKTEGKSQAEAARITGVTKGAISKNATYRKWKEEQDAKRKP
jgi:predicted DNA-binding protein (UPF0251 family)